MESSQFTDSQPQFESLESLEVQGATCDTFRVKLYGKLHFLKRLKPEYANDIRYKEAFRKEFETGYRLEHPYLVRYISLSDDGILMEYIDGETLTQRLAKHPDYFKDRKNADKFLRQLLDAVGYLHSHQVLHLDLKPDNILLTYINDDVKLIDLGCCYTDTFQDTTGHTNRFAAPEQLPTPVPTPLRDGVPIGQGGENGKGKLDARTDIYAIGLILELLPCHHLYKEVIARCTTSNPSDRYQSVEDIKHEISRKRPYLLYAILALLTVAIAVALAVVFQPPTQTSPISVVQKPLKESTIQKEVPSQTDEQPSKTIPVSAPKQRKDETIPSKDEQTQFKEEITQLIDQAYRSTIFTFCDSVFPSPSPSTGKAWADASTDFHNQIAQIGDRLIKKYPHIPESAIRQEAENRFQTLVGYVFNKMRENGKSIVVFYRKARVFEKNAVLLQKIQLTMIVVC